MSGDGWESGPNPVAHIITTRTAQVGGVATACLAGLWATLPASQFWPVVPAMGGVAVAGGLSAYFASVFHARTTWGVPLLMRLPVAPGDAMRAALTLDDGPHPDTTPRLLDLLAARNAHATFFLVGQRARVYPNLTRRIAEAGHQIGVHGLHHRTMVLQSPAQVTRDLTDCEAILTDLTGCALTARLLRPPYGFKTWTLCRTAARAGWVIAGWSLDPRDYDLHTPDTLARAVTARLAPGDIILLHERPGSSVLFDALPQILRAGAEAGIGWEIIGSEP